MKFTVFLTFVRTNSFAMVVVIGRCVVVRNGRRIMLGFRVRNTFEISLWLFSTRNDGGSVVTSAFSTFSFNFNESREL